jgi:hypothetical protein
VRRDVIDPGHPMARLLAAAGEKAFRPPAEVDTTGPTAPIAPPVPPASATYPPSSPAPQPVHVAEPEPEPESDAPATLEALAARFGQQLERPAPQQPAVENRARIAKSAAERSRQEREKQAAILARLRGEQPRT